MTFAFIILGFMDIFAELIELTYALGSATRKYLVPVIITLYVMGEMIFDKVTSQEFTLKVRATPFTTGFCRGSRFATAIA